MDWKDVYKFPLKNHYNIKAFTADGVMAFDYANWSEPDEYYQNILDIINGDKDSDLKGDFVVDGCDIYLDEELFIIVRGWGHLTGTGALNLPNYEAIKIQDDFAKYILDRLNGGNNDEQ